MFLLIGLLSVTRSRGTKNDYYLASGSIQPWLVGLSAVATNNSGYMFIGVIGYTYATGMASIWLMMGWILGDFLASLFVHSRLRQATSDSKEASFAGVLSNWYGGQNCRLQRLIGVISLLFLLAYASAQLVAGSKALHVLVDWPTWAGAAMGAVMVTFYCFAGGIRASIWTDAAQSFLMILAMAMLLVVRRFFGYRPAPCDGAVYDVARTRVYGASSALVVDALTMAVWRSRPPKGLLHHSDRGSQYASHAYQAELRKHGMVCSMSRKGDCWDNSVIERFFRSLKTERTNHRLYRTREAPRQDAIDYIAMFYNSRRLHSYLGYLSPDAYDAKAKLKAA